MKTPSTLGWLQNLKPLITNSFQANLEPYCTLYKNVLFLLLLLKFAEKTKKKKIALIWQSKMNCKLFFFIILRHSLFRLFKWHKLLYLGIAYLILFELKTSTNAIREDCTVHRRDIEYTCIIQQGCPKSFWSSLFLRPNLSFTVDFNELAQKHAKNLFLLWPTLIFDLKCFENAFKTFLGHHLFFDLIYLILIAVGSLRCDFLPHKLALPSNSCWLTATIVVFNKTPFQKILNIPDMFVTL